MQYGRRAGDPSDESGDPLHELAAEIVGKALDRRWWAMVATSLVVAAVAALAITLPITLIENHATNRAASASAQHNCQLITRIAKVMGNGDPSDPLLKAGGFISSDAGLRAAEAKGAVQIRGTGPLASLLADPQTRMLERRNAVTESVTLSYWRHSLIPALLGAARADCTG